MTTDTNSPAGAESERARHERHESFPVTGPVSAKVSTRSGDIVVTHDEVPTMTVTLRATGGAAAHLLESSEIRYDEASRTLEVISAGASVDARVGSPFGIGLGRRRSLLGAAMRDVDVDVVLPRASSVDARSKSGDVSISGESGEVEVSTASGDVVVDDGLTVKVRTASGDVAIGRGRSEVVASTASGDVVITQAPGKTKVQSASGDVRVLSSGEVTHVATASGDVTLDATGPGGVNVRSASGDVQVVVRPGLEIDVVAHSVSGHLSSAIPLDGSPGDGADEPLSLSVATVSGDVTIRRA
jgi:hypothetical protein